MQDDIRLVIDNAILYNKAGTPFYKAAQRLQTASVNLFIELEEKLCSLGVYQSSVNVKNNNDGEATVEMDDTLISSDLPVGDLEPPISILELLVSEDAIKEDIDLVLKQDPLVSLFNFELATLKPPPPPPPPPPPKAPKPKRDRKAEQERRKLAKEAEALKKAEAQALLASLDVSPGFRAPRTRNAIAAAAAFEAEANAETSLGYSPEEHSQQEAAKQRNRGWKRGPTIMPGQTDIPPIVDEVDKRQSFKMFDAGWILPENSKRGNRGTVEHPPLPPPRKRAKTSSLNFPLISQNDG